LFPEALPLRRAALIGAARLVLIGLAERVHLLEEPLRLPLRLLGLLLVQPRHLALRL